MGEAVMLKKLGGSDVISMFYTYQASSVPLIYPEGTELVLDATYAGSMIFNGGYNCPGYEKVTIKNAINSIYPSFRNQKASGARGLKTIVFEGGAKFFNANYFLDDCRTVVEVIGEIDMSECTTVYNFCTARNDLLTTISFKPNTIKVLIDILAPKLSNASLVSIGNALNGNVSGQTLRLNSSRKTAAQSLMGDVVDGLFVQNTSGTLSLADFITNTKGWTLL